MGLFGVKAGAALLHEGLARALSHLRVIAAAFAPQSVCERNSSGVYGVWDGWNPTVRERGDPQ